MFVCLLEAKTNHQKPPGVLFLILWSMVGFQETPMASSDGWLRLVGLLYPFIEQQKVLKVLMVFMGLSTIGFP